MSFATVWNYYSREDVQKALLEVAKNREVVSVFKDGSFGKRPNTLVYPQDILQEVKQGAISFHGSAERWSQPMKLTPGMLKKDMDGLRIGFDLIIDPDVKDFEIAKVTTLQLVKALEDHGVKNYSIKFTGGKSFHIGIPFEAFPSKVNFQETRLLYPELPQKIIEYLKDYIKDELRDKLLEIDTPFNLAKRIGKNLGDILGEEGIDPLKIVEIDSMVASPRHLFRLPYALHEKSLLVSLPLEPKDIMKFDKSDARPERVKVEKKFLGVKRKITDAIDLVMEALDWTSRRKIILPKIKPRKVVKRRIREIPEEFFPPCIKHILEGLPDGRKRSVFILINFLRNMGWDWEKLEKRVMEWNENNKPPLRVNYIRTQLRWHAKQERNLLPPNCDNPNFYKEPTLNVCDPDKICDGIKNPISYPFKLLKMRKRRRK
ncbi:MAG TPA: hypothetical protein ENG45_01930, partial [Candidatus Aenigmarchaeota archaeon]|nr:hypothetical protein [Candidatus Aenigmarchaeota archaeon]